MEQKRPADIFQELLEKKMKNGLTYQDREEERK